jgi:hypothetical protein
MARAKATVDPDPVNRARYEELYQVYRGIYPALKDIFPRLQAASSPDRRQAQSATDPHN